MSISTPRVPLAALLSLAPALLLGSTLSSSFSTPVFAASRADRDLGKSLFHEKGCEHCHGINGIGGEKGPDLTGVGRRLKPDAIAKQIHDGGEGMPAFGDVLAPDEVQHLVDWLATQKAKPRKPTTKPASASPAPPKLPSGGSDDQ